MDIDTVQAIRNILLGSELDWEQAQELHNLIRLRTRSACTECRMQHDESRCCCGRIRKRA